MTQRGRSVMPRLAALIIGILCLSILPMVRNWTSSSARLVSIEELPELGEMCPPELPDSASNPGAERQDTNLFSAFQEASVHAAGQDAGTATEVTRAPVRKILDKDP